MSLFCVPSKFYLTPFFFFWTRQVRGSALRDEFSCPITRELMRDPVIAADGHTYDREAIEMWLRNHDTSPKVRSVCIAPRVVLHLPSPRLVSAWYRVVYGEQHP